MASFERYDVAVARVPFGFTDRQTAINRPVLDHRPIRWVLGRLAKKDRVRVKQAMRRLLP